MERVNPDFSEKIKKYGAFDISACYNCGNCTAICPLSTEDNSFPRKMVRATVLGLENKIASSLDPWLCYYCGECSDTCPRDADPGGLMMALRRYQIRKFSVGRISDLFYQGFSSFWAWFVLTLLGVLGIFFFKNNPDMKEIKPLSFVSLNVLHDGGIILFVFLLVVSFLQLLLMLKSIKLTKKDGIGIKAYLNSFLEVFFNEVLSQNKFSKCENKKRYTAHLLLLWGFIGLFLATITVMLFDFFFPANEGIRIIPKVLGLISGIPSLYGVSFFLWYRLKKADKYFRFSHHTDWIFIILIFFAILSGYLLDILRWSSAVKIYYFTFAFHLIVVFELILTFPFTKFAHVMYRPFALLLADIKK